MTGVIESGGMGPKVLAPPGEDAGNLSPEISDMDSIDDGDDELQEISGEDSEANSEASPSDSGSDAEEESNEESQGNIFLRGGIRISEAFSKAKELTEKGNKTVLGGCRSTMKRQRVEAAEEHHDKQKRKIRLAVYKRGRMAIPAQGEDVEHDTREKELRKLATKGVVRMFNMVAKYQKEQRLARRKKAEQNRGKFLQELKTPLTAEPAKEERKTDEKKKGGQGWDALKESFTGLEGPAKDWDQFDSDEDGNVDGQDNAQSSGDEKEVPGESDESDF